MSTQQDRSNRRWLAIAVIFSLLWVAYLALFGPGLPRPSLEGSGTGEAATYDWPLRDLKDQPATLASFKGNPVFLNIWATWCGPCVREMPSIAHLAQNPRLKEKGVAFVCVSVDDDTETVRRFLEGRSWGMSFFRADGLPPVFMTSGIPATFIIGPDGRVAAQQVGSADWDNPETIALLEKLATESRPAP